MSRNEFLLISWMPESWAARSAALPWHQKMECWKIHGRFQMSRITVHHYQRLRTILGSADVWRYTFYFLAFRLWFRTVLINTKAVTNVSVAVASKTTTSLQQPSVRCWAVSFNSASFVWADNVTMGDIWINEIAYEKPSSFTIGRLVHE